VIEDLTRVVALPGSVQQTNHQFSEAGVQRISSTVLLA
jgi:hypothetical protein